MQIIIEWRDRYCLPTLESPPRTHLLLYKISEDLSLRLWSIWTCHICLLPQNRISILVSRIPKLKSMELRHFIVIASQPCWLDRTCSQGFLGSLINLTHWASRKTKLGNSSFQHISANMITLSAYSFL